MSKTVDHLMKKPANVLVPSMLFILLTPGFLINIKMDLPLINHIPYLKDIPGYMLHSVMFGLIYALLIISFPKYYF